MSFNNTDTVEHLERTICSTSKTCLPKSAVQSVSQPTSHQLNSQDQFSSWNYLLLLPRWTLCLLLQYYLCHLDAASFYTKDLPLWVLCAYYVRNPGCKTKTKKQWKKIGSWIINDYFGIFIAMVSLEMFAQKRGQGLNPVKDANTFALCNCPCSYLNPVLIAS